MIPSYIYKQIKKDDTLFSHKSIKHLLMPRYESKTHYVELTRSPYYKAVTILRHYIKVVSDYYFAVQLKAKTVDLFILTTSVSSPSGPGSDSYPVPLKFGRYKSYLTDSCQFGFEPFLLNGFNKVYAYIPSFRGDQPDSRHLNQFFMCEAEIQGSLEHVILIIEEFIALLSETLLCMPNIIGALSEDSKQTRKSLNNLFKSKPFQRMTFDDAVRVLNKSGNKSYVRNTKHGRDITAIGEVALTKLIKVQTPIWIMNYDRDRVPFYQKPMSHDHDKVVNADLIFPPISANSFGGEVVGSGQRQDTSKEILESLKRQGINPQPYNWYIQLRKNPKYTTTSGFGLGIERFVAWALGKKDIKDVSLYPRIKNEKTYP